MKLLRQMLSSDMPTPTFNSREFSDHDFRSDTEIYHNKCYTCGVIFLGYKRRPTCKVCTKES